MPEGAQTRVLIAGAGPVGLSLAIELGMRGVDCVLAEKGDGILRVPKMSSVSARGMEFCRRWGIADDVRDAVWSRTHPTDFVYTSTMMSEELARLRLGSYADREGRLDYSPEGPASCPQIYFDPILAAKAKSVPRVTARYGTRLETFDQDDAGVRAQLVDVATGAESTVAADYLIGCDGAGSVVRRGLDIAMDGRGTIATSVNVFFRSSELAVINNKGWAHIYRFFDDDGCWAELIAIDGVELWRLSVFDDPEPDLTGESYLRKLAGRDFAFEVLDVSPWERRDFVARTYRRGRVFLAGDAAHEMSPTAGAGMHTGICEAVNLAWKLQAEIEGWAGPRLLDSYEAECRPVAQDYVELSTSMYNAISALPGARAFGKLVAADQGVPGRLSPPAQRKAQIVYADSPICVADGTPVPEGRALLVPTARPGTRAPHCWIGEGRSIFDLFGDGYVLVRLASEKTDAEPLRQAAARRGVPFEIADVACDEALALYEKPLVLVRPDGHVAWRGDALPGDALALIDHVRGA
jgi:2-polyprenyl-6-methoxyphenol hydroxylase-like FAD-dependent oxidoreductase